MPRPPRAEPPDSRPRRLIINSGTPGYVVINLPGDIDGDTAAIGRAAKPGDDLRWLRADGATLFRRVAV